MKYQKLMAGTDGLHEKIIQEQKRFMTVFLKKAPGMFTN